MEFFDRMCMKGKTNGMHFNAMIASLKVRAFLLPIAFTSLFPASDAVRAEPTRGRGNAGSDGVSAAAA
eukprot:2275204-Rhodomonas_salina.2